jgi:methanogenic corrinoid protein MtbC1
MKDNVLMEQKIHEATYQKYLNGLVSANRNLCYEIVERIMENKFPIPILYESLFRDALYEVGRLWEYNRISVAIEHMATAITEGIMNQLYSDIINPERVGKQIIVSSVENESHQVGAKMVADIFEMNGWDAIYLGANTPLGELLTCISEFNPQLVGLSLSVYYNMPCLEKMLRQIHLDYPDLNVLVGGQAISDAKDFLTASYSNVTCIASLDELAQYIRSQ